MYSQPITGILTFASGSKSARQMGSVAAAGIACDDGAASCAMATESGMVLTAASEPADNNRSLLVKGTKTSGDACEACVIVWAWGEKKNLCAGAALCII